MDIGPALIADGEPAELSVPSQCALHDSTVTTELRAALDTPSGDSRLNVPLAQSLPTATVIIRLVRVQLGGPLARRSPTLPDGRDGIDERLQHAAVMHVGAGEARGERNAVGVREDVALRTGFATICRVRAGRCAPFLAATAALSKAARLKSMALRRPSRTSRTC